MNEFLKPQFGVEFSVERADDATWHGAASILNDENRNYPIFQKRWLGENYDLPWPPSDRLDFYRRIQNHIPISVIEYLATKGKRNADNSNQA